MLERVDPLSASRLPENDIKRVIRALVYHDIHNECISEHNDSEKEKYLLPAFDYRLFVLFDEREKINDRINRRVDEMIENGLENEVRTLLKNGADPSWQSMQGIGYKEMCGYINNEYTLEEAVEKIKNGTRKYAKRQITWFKREKDAVWINIGKGDPLDEIRKYIW